ncbi:NAD(P)-binding domain-containing protein [Amaricoccus solimangrovi]|uniref:NAD(P)/FAD-dependent oxidoreductase n=1 Tax=Amaricoccus solimangrovi TaxID=2589815 RepID=A0A501WQ57_9RHOB|nr:NAD(P)/FAD-dependent oxidoreductase [Amaricoccus solimangrovi]TPE50992.1 NAD(P)/FAD-dependent oxidoreductase [Amaricoccus solimangrovi]
MTLSAARTGPGTVPEAIGLARHEAEVRADLARLRLPWEPWTAARRAGGAKLLDVIVIGAGQFGVAVAGALRLRGIADLLVLDRAPEGAEGPWVTYARMPTLRSPKHLPGLSFGIPSLTFQAWYSATRGGAAWEALYKVPNEIWQDYILWARRMLGLPVENGAEAVDLVPHADRVEVVLADGTRRVAKRVVVATGRGATGGWARVPGVAEDLFPDLAAHTREAIDFARLAGKRIAMIGAGASAWDNAATAIEAGAASVTMFARRKALPQLNKGRASTGIGFFEGWQSLPDADRWRLGAYLDDMQSPPPHETIHRALAKPGVSVHFSTRVTAARRDGGAVRLEVENGPSGAYDFLILGTGFRVDLAHEPLFARIHGDVALWQDRYTPPPGLERPHLGRFPYLGDAFELLPRTPAAEAATEAAALGRIHLFNMASWLSAGTLAADVPTLEVGPDRLAQGVTARLFAEDFEPIFDRLVAWEEEHELESTAFYAPDHVNTTAR